MSAPRLTDYVKDQIVAAYLAGEACSKIAERFKVNVSYPWILAKRRGLPMRSHRNKPGVKKRIAA